MIVIQQRTGMIAALSRVYHKNNSGLFRPLVVNKLRQVNKGFAI